MTDKTLGQNIADGLRDAIAGNVTIHTMTSKAIEDVISERSRQISEEGWTPEHDDQHTDGELAHAAAAYAVLSGDRGQAQYIREEKMRPLLWPACWDEDWYKPQNQRRDLVKAGALIVAEIERLDRAND